MSVDGWRLDRAAGNRSRVITRVMKLAVQNCHVALNTERNVASSFCSDVVSGGLSWSKSELVEG